MRLVIRLALIATSLLLGLQASLEAMSADESTTTPPLPQARFIWSTQHAEYNAVLNDVDKSGAAWIYAGHWPRRTCFSDIPSDVMQPAQIACALAHLLCYCPHRLGLLDAMSLAAPAIARPWELDEALFGRDEQFAVELTDSPSLVINLELLSRLPGLAGLAVYTKRTDHQFLEAVRKVKVSVPVTLRDPAELAKKSGRVRGSVVDANGKPVAYATVMIRTRDGVPIVGSWTNDDGIFIEFRIRKAPYRIEAFAPPPFLASANSKVASSGPVNAESGDGDVRLVIDPARLVPQPPSFFNVENGDEGKRILFDPPGIEAGSRGQ
jgi:hypothetical protein